MTSEERKAIAKGQSQGWRSAAPCRGKPVSWFFPTVGEEPHPEGVALCAGCPVRTPCLDAALANHERGRWGNTSEAQRQRMRRGVEATCAGCGATVMRRERVRGDRRVWCAAPECRRMASRLGTRRGRGAA